MKRNLAVAITGASGAAYSVRLIEVLLAAGCDVHLTISPSGQAVLKHELDLAIDLENFNKANLLLEAERSATDAKLIALRARAGISSEESSVLAVQLGNTGEIHYHHYQDMMAPLASGSFLTSGMVICPCSGSTLGAIANGMGNNLIHRAAEVHLKERRKLVLVTRETPLSLPHLDNLRKTAEAGAVVLPASPGFYHGARTIRDLVDFIVGRICDQLGIENMMVSRWGG